MDIPAAKRPSLGHRLLPKSEKGSGGSHRHHCSDVSELCGKDHLSSFVPCNPVALPLAEGQNDHAIALTGLIESFVNRGARGRVWHDVQVDALKPIKQTVEEALLSF